MKSVNRTIINASTLALCLLTAQCGDRRQRDSADETFDVVIRSIQDGHIIGAIRGVREVTGFGLKDAKDLVESTLAVVLRNVPRTQAEKAAAKLRASKYIVEVRPH
jgi:large subunit ribosomal protein L7/L12